MESKLITRDLFTLLLALLLGGGVAAFSQRDEVGISSESPPTTASASAHAASSSPSSSSHASRPSPEAVACASAWESLKDGRLKREDRMQVQLKLIAEWSRHDLASALVAYFSERDQSFYRDTSFFGDHLLPAMAAEPVLVEDLLKSGRLGLATPRLRDQWLMHLGEADPVGTLNRLHELPVIHRQSFLSHVISTLPSIHEEPATWQSAMDRLSSILAGSPSVSETEGIREGLYVAMNGTDLNTAYLATTDSRLRGQFAVTANDIIRTSKGHENHSDIATAIQSLPEPLRSAVLERRKEYEEEPLPPPDE